MLLIGNSEKQITYSEATIREFAVNGQTETSNFIFAQTVEYVLSRNNFRGNKIIL